MSFNNINVNVSGPMQPTSTYKTVVLKGQASFAVQVTEPNTKYVIKHNFDLGGENVTIPANCVLEFDGGSISNGTLNVNNAEIVSSYSVFKNITLLGKIKNTIINADWFVWGETEDDKVQNGDLFTNLASFGKHIHFGAKTYYIQLDETVFERGTRIKGVDKELTQFLVYPSSNTNRFIFGLSRNCGIENCYISYKGDNIPIDVVRIDRWFGMDSADWEIVLKNMEIWYHNGAYYPGTDTLFPVGVHLIHGVTDNYDGRYLIDKDGVRHEPAIGCSYKQNIDFVGIYRFKYGVQITLEDDLESGLWINSLSFRNLIVVCAAGFFFDKTGTGNGVITRFNIINCLYNALANTFVTVPSRTVQDAAAIIGYVDKLQLIGLNVYDTNKKYAVDGSIYDYCSIYVGLSVAAYQKSFQNSYTPNGTIEVNFVDDKSNRIILSLGSYQGTNTYKSAILSDTDGIIEIIKYLDNVNPYDVQDKITKRQTADGFVKRAYFNGEKCTKRIKSETIEDEYKVPVIQDRTTALYTLYKSANHGNVKIIHATSNLSFNAAFSGDNVDTFIVLGNINFASDVDFPLKKHIIFLNGTITNTSNSQKTIRLNSVFLDGTWENAFIGDIAFAGVSNRIWDSTTTESATGKMFTKGSIIYDTYFNRLAIKGNDGKWLDSDGKSHLFRQGGDGSVPTLTGANNVGYQFFHTTRKMPQYWDGEDWLNSDGVIAGTPRSGTFADKPTVSTNKIPVGFGYFCTDKQTTEGATDGIMIYHKGSDVWVDALGRVVS